MLDIKTIIAIILFLCVSAFLFYLSYNSYVTSGNFNLIAAVWATGGIAIIMGVIKAVFFSSKTREMTPKEEGGDRSGARNTQAPQFWWRNK